MYSWKQWLADAIGGGAANASVRSTRLCKTPELPLVEQCESRLYLGGIVSSALADFATPSEASSQTAAQELAVHAEVGTDAGTLIDELAGNASTIDSAAHHPSAAPVSPTSPADGPAQNAASPQHTSPLLGPILSSGLEAADSVAFTPIEPPPNDDLAGVEPTRADLEEGGEDSAVIAEGPAIATDSVAISSQFAVAGAAGSLAGVHSDAPAAATAIAPAAVMLADAQLEAAEVGVLLERASRATSSNDAIIAVVDRNGRILGVRVEQGVLDAIPDPDTLVFAIDGAVAKARTAAMFSNGDPNSSLAPLTSRTVRFISQTTNTQREVESNPNVDGDSLADANSSTVRGPGFVAPIGVGGHFPPEVMFTPPVDLFAIEHTNRDSNLHPGADGIRGTADDFQLRTGTLDDTGMAIELTDDNNETIGRFNLNPNFVPEGQGLYAPESYGHVSNSGLLPDAQSRGIATLPGGIPLFRDTDMDGLGDTLVGGIGVFFPGEDGYATHEQGFVPGVGQSELDRTNAPRVLEAEFIALAAAGGSQGASATMPGAKIGDIGGVAPVYGLDLPFGRLDLVGITLEVIGPGSNQTGFKAVFDQGATVGPGVGPDGTIAAGPENSGMVMPLANTEGGTAFRNGNVVPEGWLVTPHGSAVDDITAADVEEIIQRAITAAEQTRAAVRLPLGSRTKMVFAIADTDGEILGLYRMPNATTFSIDVAVAKARNTAYYADADDLQAIDQVVEAGVAFTNRTFRFLAEPRYPSGIDGTTPPPFSILNDDNINRFTGENIGAPGTVSEFDSVKGHDAFFPMTNFRDPGDASVVADAGNQPLANQNGIVFFPGSTPLYKDGKLIGGFGVSGDGVDQDDVVTYLGARDYLPNGVVTRADEVFFRDVRLPYQKFLRNPFG